MQTHYLLKRLAVLSTAVFMMMIFGCQPEMVGPDAPPAPPNSPPKPDTPFFKANAGADLILYVPFTDTVLDGSASVDTGRVATSYIWRQLSGVALIIGTASGRKVPITAIEVGEYQFELKVSSSKYGTFSLDTVKVTVIDNFARGVKPKLEIRCDTLFSDEKQSTQMLYVTGYVDSANIRYYLTKGYSASLLYGPTAARIEPIAVTGGYQYFRIDNLSGGLYAFRVGAERGGLVGYDTLYFQKLPDTALGKTYVFESFWQLQDFSNVPGSEKYTMAEFRGLQHLLLNQNFREWTAELDELNNGNWKAWSTDYMMNEYMTSNECGTAITANKMYADAALVGKKVRARIRITK